MTRITEIDIWESHIFPCECADGDYLRFTWDPDDGDARWMWVENLHAPHGWKNRLRLCWRILTGRITSTGEVILNEKVVDSLYDLLSEKKNA